MSQFDDLKSKILYAIWAASQTPGSKSELSMTEIEEVLPEWVTGQTRAAIESLGGDGRLSRQGGAGKFYISEAGIRSVEYDITNPGNLTYALDYARHVQEAHRLKRPNIGLPVPAADRTVPLDHNSDSYKDAIAALDDALSAFKEDYRLDNEWGSEKAALLQTVEKGRELLNETSTHVATIYATVVTPLRVLRDRYEHAIVAGIITAAVDQFLPACGRAITAVLALIGLA